MNKNFFEYLWQEFRSGIPVMLSILIFVLLTPPAFISSWALTMKVLNILPTCEVQK
jgi:hypothetical protein